LAILTETIARSPVEYMPNGVAKTYDLNRWRYAQISQWLGQKNPFFRIALGRKVASGGRGSSRIVRKEERRRVGSRRGLAVRQPVREPTLGRRIATRKINCVIMFLAKTFNVCTYLRDAFRTVLY
jgi:hypothetical protein